MWPVNTFSCPHSCGIKGILERDGLNSLATQVILTDKARELMKEAIEDAHRRVLGADPNLFT
jgi:hypothetical protein